MREANIQEKFKEFSEYIRQNEPDGRTIDYFQKVLELFEKSDAPNRICPGQKKEDCLLQLLHLLKDELNTYANTLIAAVVSQSIKGLAALKEVEKEFPEQTIKITEAFFNIRKLKFGNIAAQPDEARSLILSVAADMRAVLLDFAIQIIRVRNREQLKKTKLVETVFDLVEYIYIPIAHRLGFYQLKSELEDRVLAYRKPEIYAALKAKLDADKEARDKLIAEFIGPVTKELDNHGLKYIVKSRTKSVSSIWAKMQKQDIPFERVFDLWAVRIIIDSEAKNEKADCWHVYSVLTNIYKPNLSRLRDWITVPKETGYESLHATVQAPNKHWVEVQIRTRRMDDEAENGMAAHWRYKGGKGRHGVDFWLQNIREALEKSGGKNPNSFVLSSKKFSNEVYVFTPAGDVKKLRMGSTVLDFAFAIHTDIGSRFASATVNGKIVPIEYVLRNGDQVSIQTSKNNRPSADWLNIVVDPRTKNKIKRVLDEKRQQEVELGKQIMERRFKNWKMDFNQDVVDEAVKKLRLKRTSDLYFLVATEKLDLLEIKKLLSEDSKEENILKAEEIENPDIDDANNDNVLIVDKLDNVNFTLAKCCNPIAGDPIFGFVTVSKGISIHRKDCPNARQMRERFPYRIIESRWKDKAQARNFTVNLKLKGENEPDLILNISQLISKEMKVQILSLNINANDKDFSGNLKVRVHDNEVLAVLMEALQKIKGIHSVFR